MTGTTALYGDCEVVFPRAGENMTSWTFYWTAPATDGTVELFYGAVDGDCMMSSFEDAVVVAKKTLRAATASRARPARPPIPYGPAAGLALALGIAAAVLIVRRRHPPA